MIFGSHANSAGDSGNLSGTFDLRNEQQDACKKGITNDGCKMNFYITGDAARVLYERMKVKVLADNCGDSTTKTKIDEDGLWCTMSADKVFECNFAYNFARKKIVGSDMDC
jgi:hypothetical protein